MATNSLINHVKLLTTKYSNPSAGKQVPVPQKKSSNRFTGVDTQIENISVSSDDYSVSSESLPKVKGNKFLKKNQPTHAAKQLNDIELLSPRFEESDDDVAEVGNLMSRIVAAEARSIDSPLVSASAVEYKSLEKSETDVGLSEQERNNSLSNSLQDLNVVPIKLSSVATEEDRSPSVSSISQLQLLNMAELPEIADIITEETHSANITGGPEMLTGSVSELQHLPAEIDGDDDPNKLKSGSPTAAGGKRDRRGHVVDCPSSSSASPTADTLQMTSPLHQMLDVRNLITPATEDTTAKTERTESRVSFRDGPADQVFYDDDDNYDDESFDSSADEAGTPADTDGHLDLNSEPVVDAIQSFEIDSVIETVDSVSLTEGLDNDDATKKDADALTSAHSSTCRRNSNSGSAGPTSDEDNRTSLSLTPLPRINQKSELRTQSSERHEKARSQQPIMTSTPAAAVTTIQRACESPTDDITLTQATGANVPVSGLSLSRIEQSQDPGPFHSTAKGAITMNSTPPPVGLSSLADILFRSQLEAIRHNLVVSRQRYETTFGEQTRGTDESSGQSQYRYVTWADTVQIIQEERERRRQRKRRKRKQQAVRSQMATSQITCANQSGQVRKKSAIKTDRNRRQ